MAENLGSQLKDRVGDIQTGIGLPERLSSVPAVIATLTNVIFLSAAVIFVIMFLFGGVGYLSGSGNEEATAKARRQMLDAVIGLVITLAAYAITRFVLTSFGYTGI